MTSRTCCDAVEPASAAERRSRQRIRTATSFGLLFALLLGSSTASAVPSLGVQFGFPVGGGSCVTLLNESAATGPLVREQHCEKNIFVARQSGDLFATADYGALGASATMRLLSPARLFSSVNAGGATAQFTGDYLFSGPATGPLGTTSVQLNLDLDGVLAGVGSFVQLDVALGGRTKRAVVRRTESGLEQIQNFDFGDTDLSPLLAIGGGRIDILTSPFIVPVGEPVSFRMALTALASAVSRGEGVSTEVSSDFDSTLTFNRDGPVFSLADGIAVTGTGITDNRFGSPPSASVPAPSTAWLAALGLGCVAWLRRRRTVQPAAFELA